ncbi:MAG: hypothetical protein SWQ30_21835 [Thermodesulfobacteriota bacterium]|nr:hypothetical protein [Thermodesulfobacteriota bacterium]
MKIVFPIPRITETFIDKAVEKVGGRRLHESEKSEGIQNADYILPGAVAELKIVEEEGLEKESRQKKIRKFLSDRYVLPREVEIDIRAIPEEIKPEYRQILGGPIQTAVKKAAKQIKITKAHLKKNLDLRILIAVNNGYGSLPDDEFEKLVLLYARKDSSQIDFVICSTVDHYQCAFDTYVFISSHCYPATEGLQYQKADGFIQAVNELFGEAMTCMMQNQMDSKLCDSNLPPISDILFEGEGVTYIRSAPDVPDSRFVNQNTEQRH